MATLTTSPQIIGKNESGTIKTYLYGWYSNQSGNTCTVHTKLTVISSGITYTGTNKTYSMQLGGYNSGTQSWSYAPLNANTEYTVTETTWTYAGGESISASAGFWSYVYGNADIGLAEATYVPTFSSAPTGLSVSIAEIYSNGAKLNISVTSYGNPLAEPGRYIEAGLGTKSTWTTPLRSAKATNVNSAQLTVNNSSTVQTGLTIKPNKQYYYGGYAWNTQVDTSRMFGQLVTAINSPSFSISTRTNTSATIRYSAEADGGYYNKTVQYSIDGGTTWDTGVVITTGSAATGTFTINNLSPSTEYTVLTRTSTPVSTVNGPSIILSNKTTKLYGGVNNQAKCILDLYGPSSTVAGMLGNIEISGVKNVTAFDGDAFWAAYSTIFNSLAFNYLMVSCYSSSKFILYMYYTDSTPRQTLAQNLTAAQLEAVGVTVASQNNGSDYVWIRPKYSPINISKLYASVDGEAKLIYQGFGHINYNE